MATESSEAGFWSSNLQESIQTAGQQNKPLLCFVTDESPTSLEWSKAIATGPSSRATVDATVRLRIHKDSQEFAFLTSVCPLGQSPALVLIRAGQIEEKLEHPETSTQQLRDRLSLLYPAVEGIQEPPHVDEPEQCLEFESSTGRMRLPNNAYDALREQTEKWKAQSVSPKNILLLQLRSLEKISNLKQTVSAIKSRAPGTRPVLPEDAVNRLLNTPSSALQPGQTSSSSANQTPPPTIPTTTSEQDASGQSWPSPPTVNHSESSTAGSQAPHLTSTHQSQRNDYVKQQKERETAQRLERDRIKAQIKSDREERRRLDQLRKESELASLREQNSTTSSPSSTDIRLQVRTFDGTTLRTTFPRTANIASDVRTWVDQSNSNNNTNNAPYNLKLILTPLPNRSIETAEEEKPLPELGIVGSATMVMVPVRGYVDSYAGSGSGMGVFGGLLGTTGRLIDWTLGRFGYGSTTEDPQSQSQAESQASSQSTGESDVNASGTQVKVRTLADQRADEDRKRGNQLYNGNSLDFQGRADDDDKKDD